MDTSGIVSLDALHLIKAKISKFWSWAQEVYLAVEVKFIQTGSLDCKHIKSFIRKLGHRCITKSSQ